MLGQDINFNLISLSILSSCLLDNVLIVQGEVICSLFLGVGELKRNTWRK